MSSFRESRQKTNNDGPFLHLFVLFRKNRGRGCLFCPCCHVWSLLSKKTTPTLPLLHRQAKKRADSCSGYRPEIPAERAAAGGEGRQRRRVAARPWGEEALSPRGRASHSVDGGIDSVRDDVILAHSAALLLSGPAAACTNQCQASDETCSALAWAHHDNSILIQIAASPFAATRGCRNIFTPTCLRFPSLATSSVPVRTSFVLFEETAEVSNWLR